MRLHSLFGAFALSSLALAQSEGGEGYIGYSLNKRGDPESVIYETENTPAGVERSNLPPDVYLNASVHVGEISIEVDNLTAKVNLDAQVLQLLDFRAGVDASIERVHLLIQNVTAKVHLEARLENLVHMISNVLDSLDLNPLVATIGQGVGRIVDGVGEVVDGVVGGEGDEGGSESAGTLERRDFKQEQNILYSINDYSGNAHTNRVLKRNGQIVDQELKNDGEIYGERVVGSYESDMEHTGMTRMVMKDGVEMEEKDYAYNPFIGLNIVAHVYVDASGRVRDTRVIAESGGGGSSTVGANEEDL